MSRLSVIVVRHGERLDYVDRSWVTRAGDEYWDAPLTKVGC